MSGSRDKKKHSFRAGDQIIYKKGCVDAIGFTFAYSDGVYAYGIGAGEQRFRLENCGLRSNRATYRQHVDALEALSKSVGSNREVTPERIQKGDITQVFVLDKNSDDYDEVRRSCGLLYSMRRAGKISDAAVAAAEHWARDYETGILGARDPEKSRQCGLPDAEYAILSRVAAADRYRYVKFCIGTVGETLLYKMMVEGLSIVQMSSAMNKDRNRLGGAIELLLEQLAEVYSNLPGKMWFYKTK